MNSNLRLSLILLLAAGLVAVLEMFGLIQYPSREIEIMSPRPGVLSKWQASSPV